MVWLDHDVCIEAQHSTSAGDQCAEKALQRINSCRLSGGIMRAMKARSIFASLAALAGCGVLWFGSSAVGQTRSSEDEGMTKIAAAKEAEELTCLKTGDLKHFGEMFSDDAIFIDARGQAKKSE